MDFTEHLHLCSMEKKDPKTKTARAWLGGVAKVLAMVALSTCRSSNSLVTELDAEPHDDAASATATTNASIATPRDALAPKAEAAVLVVLDGVRWQEIWHGVDMSMSGAVRAQTAAELMPNLHGLATLRGASVGAPGRGAPIVASGPHYVSLPGYTELFTGRVPPCRDNDCARTREPTIADELVRRGEPVAVFSSWERIDRAATSDPDSRFVLSTGRKIVRGAIDAALLSEGAAAQPWPGGGDFRPDRFTAKAALAHLEHARPTFMFLGLGEPDEYAHHGDYPGYLASLRAADAVLGELVATLARMGERGAKTSIVVTTDHGRAKTFQAHGGAFPESGRVWLVAAGAGIDARGPIESASKHALADVAPTLRLLLGAPETNEAPGKGGRRGQVLSELFVRPSG